MKTHTTTLTKPGLVTDTGTGLLTKFNHWADRLDYYRLVLLVAAISIQGCITAPFALWSMHAIVGFNVVQLTIVTLSSFGILVSNLAVQPMRVSIPVFVVVTVSQLVVIVMNLLQLV